MRLRGGGVTEQERLAVEFLEAIEAARGSKGYCSARKLELWARRRFGLRRKKCGRCGEWLTDSAFRAASGYRFGLAACCRQCERHRIMCPEGCDPGTAAATHAP